MTEKAEQSVMEMLVHANASIEAHGARLVTHSRFVGELAADNLETKKLLHELTATLRILSHTLSVHLVRSNSRLAPRTGQ